MDIETLIRMVMDCAMRVRRQLAPGYEEKIYQTAMAIELKERKKRMSLCLKYICSYSYGK